MSALRKYGPSARPDEYTTYTEVEVNIDATELEEAGWIWVGKEKGVPTSETVLDVVRRWHDDAHDGPWMWCAEQPCDTLRGRSEG